MTMKSRPGRRTKGRHEKNKGHKARWVATPQQLPGRNVGAGAEAGAELELGLELGLGPDDGAEERQSASEPETDGQTDRQGGEQRPQQSRWLDWEEVRREQKKRQEKR